MSYEDIGAEFKKHHSTVMYNIDQIEKDIETDTKLARQINDIISNAKVFNSFHKIFNIFYFLINNGCGKLIFYTI